MAIRPITFLSSAQNNARLASSSDGNSAYNSAPQPSLKTRREKRTLLKQAQAIQDKDPDTANFLKNKAQAL